MKSLYESILSSTNTGKESIIKAWLDKNGIKKYTINDKLEIDVDGCVFLTNNHLSEFPKYIQFNIVKRDFYCSFNGLTSLRGVPREVGGKFDCSNNSLTTLEDSPKKVGGDFECHHNKLKTLEGAPKEVGGDFYCSGNDLTTLEGAPEKVGGWFHCENNKLTSLEGAPKEAKYFNCENNTTKFTEKDVRKVCKVEKKILV